MTDGGNGSSVGGDILEGTTTNVRRDGTRIVRARRPNSEAVMTLLRHVNSKGLARVPRPIELTDQHEVLSYLDGRPIRRPWPQALFEDEFLKDLGNWLRNLDDATADFSMPDGQSFAWGPVWEPGLCVNHGDLGPWNLLLGEGERMIGLIDWDMARWGVRGDNLFEAILEFAPLRTLESVSISSERAWERMQVLAAGFGVSLEPGDVLDRLINMLEGRIEGALGAASQGSELFMVLISNGYARNLRKDVKHLKQLRESQENV